MDDLPLTQEEAKKLLEEASPQATPSATAPRRIRSRSSGMGVPTGKRGLTPNQRSSARTPFLKPATPALGAGFAMIVGTLVAVVVAVVGLLGWSGGGAAPVEKSAASKKLQDKSETHLSSALKGPFQKGHEIGSTAEGLRSNERAKTSTSAEPLSASESKRSAEFPEAPASGKPWSAPENEKKAAVNTPSTPLPVSPQTQDGLENPKHAPMDQTKAPGQAARQGKGAQPEPHGPEPDATVSKPHETTPKADEAAKLAKATFGGYLIAFDEALSKGDLVGACAAVERAQADPALKGVEKVANEVASLVRFGELLTATAVSEQRTLEALRDGKKRTFRTAKGSVTGVVDKVEGDTLVVNVTGQINKQVIEYKQRVKLSQLTLACRESVLGERTPATPDEWLAEMFRNLAAKELKQAAQALMKASAHPLAAHYQETLPELRLEKTVAAEGGVVTSYTQDGKNFRVHTFTADGTFSVTAGGTIEYLVVAGGGGTKAGNTNGGAGGGEVLAGSFAASATTYPVVVGAGGNKTTPAAGGQSSAFGVTANGGGIPGGSTGGTSGNGNAGGVDSGTSYAGGGGGAGAAGNNGVQDKAGNGGIGTASSISGTSTYYGGGGGGGAQVDSGSYVQAGDGGLGGGGGGGTGHNDHSHIPRDGTSNTGGGAGGASLGGATGAVGGSGIVIIRYRVVSGDSNLRFWISD